MGLKIAVLAAAMSAVSSAAVADCELKSVRVVSEGVVLRYDPFDRSDTPVELPLRVDGTDECVNARVQMSIMPELDSIGPAGSLQASDGRSAVVVDLLSQGMNARIVTEPSNAFSGSAPVGRMSSTGVLTGPGLRTLVPYGQVVAPGLYRARARLLTQILDAEGEASAVIETPFFIEVVVQPSFRLAAGVERQLFLGELREGAESAPVRFNAFANVGYELRVRSDRNWRLTLAGSEALGGPAVPYRASISGRPVDAGDGEVATLVFDQPSGEGVRSHDLKTTALAFAPQPAGRYEDQITIEIGPRIS